MHKWHFAEHEDPKIPLYKVSVHSDFVICQLLLAFFFCSSSDSVKNRCLLNTELREGRRTDGSATFFLLISTELLSHRNQELFFLPLVCVWSVSCSVAAFTGLWGHSCSFLLGAHRCKTISRAAASSVGKEWQGAGKTFLCEEADV